MAKKKSVKAKSKAAAKSETIEDKSILQLRVEVSVSREQRALGPNITLWSNPTNQPISTKSTQVVVLLNSVSKEIEDCYLAPLPLGATEDVVVFDVTTYRRPSGQIECVGGVEPLVSVRATYEDLIKFCEVDLARQYAEMHAQAVQDFRAEFTGDVVTDPSSVDLGSINAEEAVEAEEEEVEEEAEEAVEDEIEDVDSLEESPPFEIDEDEELEDLASLEDSAEDQSSAEEVEDDDEEIEEVEDDDEEIEDFDDDDEVEELEDDDEEEIEEVEDDDEEEIEDFDDDDEVEELEDDDEEIEDFDDDDEVEDEVEEVEDADDEMEALLKSFDSLSLDEARNIAISVGVSPLVAKKVASAAKLKQLFKEKVL